jgi:hypothetical protein
MVTQATPLTGRCPECGHKVTLPCVRCRALAAMTKKSGAQLPQLPEPETNFTSGKRMSDKTGRPARPKPEMSEAGRRAHLATLVDRFHDGDYRGITFDNLAPVTLAELPEGCERYATAPDTEDRYTVAEGGEACSL